MISTIGKTVFVIMICLALVSCGSMKARHVAGESIAVFDKEMTKQCIWLFEGQVFHVTPTGPSTAVVSSLQWDDSKKDYVKKSGQIHLSSLKDEELIFMNVKMGNDDFYTILRIIGATNEQDFILFTVDSDTIESHMNQGIVKASKKEGDYVFDLGKKELDAYVRKYRDQLFNHDIAGILERIYCRE